MLIQLARKLHARHNAKALLQQARRSFEAGALEDADRHCSVMAEQHPDALPEAHELHVALAQALAGRRKHGRAAFHLGRALAGLPGDDARRRQLALQLILQHREDGDEEAAADCCRELLRANPDDRDAMELLAVCIQAHETEKARELMAAVVAPTDVCGRLRRTLMLPAILQSTSEIEFVRERFERELDELLAERFDPVANPEMRVGTAAFRLAYHARNNAPLLAKLARLCRRIYPAAGDGPRRLPKRGRRLRVGFVSTFFHRHSVGRTTYGLMRDLPRSEFETFVFAIQPKDDPLAAAYREHAEHYALLPFDMARVREAIRAADLDMLLFADIGMHPFTYFLAFWRLAPIQLVTWGHSVTSGIDSLDYYVSAEGVETPQSDAYYTEKLLRLPGFFMPRYERVVLERRKSRDELGLPADAHVYYCPQSPFKLHPDFDGLLRGILERDPRAGILLLDGWPRSAPRLRERFARTLGSLAERVHFVGRMQTEDFLQYLAAADVILDPMHFGGCNSSCETFALGQPMATLPGEQLPGRFTMALYREMGMEDCIARNAVEYIDIAVRLACDTEYRAAVKSRIAERSGRLFERPDAGLSFGRELLRLAEERG